MRLTLRTLLAYLDDILDPDDAQDLAKRIEVSEFATDVVNRTRDVMSRTRLGAPELSGRGMGVDPNTVAEYLDSTLPPERVPDFEKVCLESNVHLAEVACCHQILTLVLGEPAHVDPASRERMHQLVLKGVAEQSAAVKAAPGAASEAPPAETDGKTPGRDKSPARHKPEIPQELREAAAPWGVWKVAAAILLVALLGGIIAVSSQPQWVEQVAFWRRGPGVAPATPSADHGQAANGGAAGATPEGQPASAPSATEAAGPAAEAGSATEPELRQPASVESPDRVPDDVPAEEPAVAPVPAETTEAPAEPAAGEAASATETTEGPPAAPEVHPAAETEPGSAIEPAATDAAATGEPAAGQPVEVPKDGIGRYISSDTVVLRFDAQGQQWRRLPPQDVLFAGERLRSLPTYRSTLALSNGLTLLLIGETELTLEGADAQGVQVVTLAYGRAVLMTVGKAQTRVHLRAGDRRGTLTFDDGGSTVAVEVRPLRPEGSDPEAAPPQSQVHLYATSAKIVWDDATTGEQLSLAAPQERILGQPLAAEGSETPAWIAADLLDELDEKASKAVEEHLRQVDRSTALSLQELAEHRRSEIRSLAVRCLGAIDQFEPLVAALNDPGQKASWNDHVDALRGAIARGPQTAALVHQAFVTLRAERAGDLYRMLWGYASDSFKPEDAETLVKRLDHQDLDYRVLSFWNLRNLTGFSLFYRPEYPEARRATYVQKWQQKLKSGQIVPKKES